MVPLSYNIVKAKNNNWTYTKFSPKLYPLLTIHLTMATIPTKTLTLIPTLTQIQAVENEIFFFHWLAM